MSFRTPMKNSSPLANYSFTTPSSSSSSSAQNDTFIQNRFNKRPSSNNSDLIHLAALNNLSTPKRQTATLDDHIKEPQPQQQQFFSSPLKLRPMVESPFKVRKDPSNNEQQQQEPVQQAQQTQRSLFHQEPGRFTSNNSENTRNLLNNNNKITSFEPILNDNVVMAMTRLQNKEFSLKKFITNLFGLLVLKLVNSVVKFLYYNTSILDLVHDNFYNETVVKSGNYIVIAFISINLVTSSLRLLEKQDQCLDLDLNNEQRKLLGLELVLEQHEEEITGQQEVKPEVVLKVVNTPVKQILNEQQKEIDTIGRTNDLLSKLKLSTPRGN